MAESRCLIPVCHGGGDWKKITDQGIKTLVSSSKARRDEEFCTKLQGIVDGGGDAACIECHKGCYCSYTSKQKIERLHKSLKRNAQGECVVATTRSRAQATGSGLFVYKRDCIFCGNECLPVDEKHPERWDRVRQCMTKERFDKEGNPIQTMKNAILDAAEQRNDDVARRVKLNIGYVVDLPAAECKYHVRCYNSFMKVPKYTDLPTVVEEESALQKVIECMNRDRSKIWNSIELHSLYCDFGGKLDRRDMFGKLSDHVSKDVMLVQIVAWPLLHH